MNRRYAKALERAMAASSEFDGEAWSTLSRFGSDIPHDALLTAAALNQEPGPSPGAAFLMGMLVGLQLERDSE